jgi:hypothetical protein
MALLATRRRVTSSARWNTVLVALTMVACGGSTAPGDGDLPTDTLRADDRGGSDVVSVDAPADVRALDASVDVPGVDPDGATPDGDRRDGMVGFDASRDVAAGDVVRDGGGSDVAGDAARCDAQDARGVGLCARFLGYFWNGTMCVGLSGCSCAGADCMSPFGSPTECEAAYLPCVSPRDCRTTGCPAPSTCEPCRGPGGPVYVCVPAGSAC